MKQQEVEQLLSTSLQAAEFPVHIAHPNKVRNFARTKGKLAKTDRIDAKIMSEFGKVFKPNPKVNHLTPQLKVLHILFIRRQQLLDEKIRENNRLDKNLLEILQKSIKIHIHWFESELEATEHLIVEHIKSYDNIKKSVELLKSIPGIGILTAICLLIELPELGKIEDKKLASLVGVAPLNRGSGKMIEKRYIKGGRSSVRKNLYMTAVVSVRFNPDMKIFYQHLQAKRKIAKVALTAVIRKLLILLNSIARRRTPWKNKTEILIASR